MKKTKVSFFKSMKVKITLIGIVAAFFMALVLILLIIPTVREQYIELAQNYMTDVCNTSSTIIQNQAKTNDGKISGDEYASALKSIKIGSFSTSYAYAVDQDGTMVYHSTADKIGKPVSNSCIKQVVADIKSGTNKQKEFVSYEYNGAQKYAAYNVLDNVNGGKVIIVVTADESDVIQNVNSVRTTALIIGSVLLVIVIVVAFLVALIVAKPFLRVTEAVNTLAELEIKVDDKTKKLSGRGDEAGIMAKAVCTLSDNLARIVGEIQTRSNTLFTTAEELSLNATDTVNSVHQVEIAVTEVAEGATSQAQETTDATNNVVQIGEMIAKTNEQVEKLKDNSQAIDTAAGEASEILNRLLSTNIKATESVNMIHERTIQTNESVQEIKAAISLITSIAEETNLLSLNASIEAARAGEQGRGFAVVASQIQKLAEQSNESAKQIEQITEKLILDSKQAVAGMQEVLEIMETQTSQVKDTNGAFTSVKENVSYSLKGISDIADMARNLDRAKDAVTDSVQNLSAIAQENAASSEECSASVTEVCNIMDKVTSDTVSLKDISQDIDNQLSTFKL